jgi:MFS family permease
MRLERATGIRGAIQRGSILAGAPVGGILVATFGAPTALLLDAASFLLSAAAVAGLVPRPRREPDVAPPGRFLAELATGVRFIRRHRLIRAVVLTVLVTNFLDAPLPVLMPVFAREAFGSAVDLGLMLGCFGGFGLAGSLLFGMVGHRLPRRLTFLSGFVVWAAVYVVLSALPSFPVTLAALALGGLAMGPINPLLATVGFELVPKELRGRVFGAITAGAWASIPAGVLLGGLIVEAVGVGPTFLAIGVCYLAVSAFGFVNPAFREFGRAPAASASEAGARS